MRNITITDGVDVVVLMKDLVFSITPQNVGKKATMASGSDVMDLVGTKDVLTVPTGWLSPEDLHKLRSMINRSQILTVTYPDTNGYSTKEFFVDQPEYKAFKYDDGGVSQWYGVTLTMTQRGVNK